MTNEQWHFVGIGGIGMSGLARMLLDRGEKVSGSDTAKNALTESLRERGAEVYLGHDRSHVKKGSRVIYTSAVKACNPELQQAQELNCPTLHRSELLRDLAQQQKILAITGTHGKTTTSALLTWVLHSVGWAPSFNVGGILATMETNGGWGTGPYFVLEADESDGSFLRFQPFGAIITNLEEDHLDHYGDFGSVISAMNQFMGQVSSQDHLLYCADDPALQAMAVSGIGYGFQDQCGLQGSNYQQHGWHSTFDVTFKAKSYREIKIALPGRHNALNAVAVFGLAIMLGVPEEGIRHALATFPGVSRRLERKGEKDEILILDDYAHHPTEVDFMLRSVRDAVGDRRIWAIFQPHRYSRLSHCLDAFADVFHWADEVVVTDVYAAGEKPINSVDAQAILHRLQRCQSIGTHYVPKNEIIPFLTKQWRPHDVVVTIGAGDITRLGSDLFHHLNQNPPKKWRVGVVFGGRSQEHEVSIRSARFVKESLNPDLYDVQVFGIDRNGQWRPHEESLEWLYRKEVTPKDEEEAPISPLVLDEVDSCDVLFPVLHGPYGEDGTLQGFFEVLRKPYVGCDSRSAALCMDKTIAKRLVEGEGVSTVPGLTLTEAEWHQQRSGCLEKIGKLIGFPLFVKPSHLGSSVGISRVEKQEQLPQALIDAFRFDQTVTIEKEVKGRQIEFPVLGHDPTALWPGEILCDGQFYDYDAKYGPNCFGVAPEAEMEAEKGEEGKQLATLAYRALGCSGFNRVDFFLDSTGKYWFNEANPIPGLTPTSLFPKACEASGINGPKLMDRLVVAGIRRWRLQERREIRYVG